MSTFVTRLFVFSFVFFNGVYGEQCMFTASNDGTKHLNLTNYIQALNATNGVQCSMQGCSGCGYKFSVCKNGVLCDTENENVMVIQNSVSNGKCSHELGIWDNTIKPYYISSNNSWSFQYQNGGKCDEDPTMNYAFQVIFICSNDTWPQAQTGPSGTCQYQMTIASIYSC